MNIPTTLDGKTVVKVPQPFTVIDKRRGHLIIQTAWANHIRPGDPCALTRFDGAGYAMYRATAVDRTIVELDFLPDGTVRTMIAADRRRTR